MSRYTGTVIYIRNKETRVRWLYESKFIEQVKIRAKIRIQWYNYRCTTIYEFWTESSHVQYILSTCQTVSHETIALIFISWLVTSETGLWCNVRHGVRQLRTGWSDGPAYITQCPIQTGQSYIYNFTLTGQRGTLWWHAHVNWLRATVHGAIVILPKLGVPYPFPKPHKEEIIILG